MALTKLGYLLTKWSFLANSNSNSFMSLVQDRTLRNTYNKGITTNALRATYYIHNKHNDMQHTIIQKLSLSGCQIRIFRRESNGFPKLHRLGVRKKFWGFMLCLDVVAPHFHRETRIPKCISSGNPLKKLGCTDPHLPLIWQPGVWHDISISWHGGKEL